MSDLKSKTLVPLLAVVVGLNACAAPMPILQMTGHLETMGEKRAQEDITECQQRAEKEQIDPGETRGKKIAQGASLYALGGAAVGAIGGITSGASGVAALIGASVLGVVGGIAGAVAPLEPDNRYSSHIGSCLKEKGYKLRGWH